MKHFLLAIVITGAVLSGFAPMTSASHEQDSDRDCSLTFRFFDEKDSTIGSMDHALRESGDNQPPTIAYLEETGNPRSYELTRHIRFEAVDPDGTFVTIVVDWGDGEPLHTISNVPSGADRTDDHKYSYVGTYMVSVHATDSSNTISSITVIFIKIKSEPSSGNDGSDAMCAMGIIIIVIAAIAGFILLKAREISGKPRAERPITIRGKDSNYAVEHIDKEPVQQDVPAETKPPVPAPIEVEDVEPEPIEEPPNEKPMIKPPPPMDDELIE